MLVFAQFGAGRIGAIHAANLAASGGARLAHVVPRKDSEVTLAA